MDKATVSPASIESPMEISSPQGLATQKKRKAETPGESKRSIKKKKKPNMAKENEDETLDLEQGVNKSIAKFDNRLLADFVAQRTKRFDPGLTLVELEDRHIPGRLIQFLREVISAGLRMKTEANAEQAFRDTSGFDKLRILENLPAYLINSVSKAEKRQELASAPEAPGSPHTLIITAAGLRAADITRALRTFQSKDSIVGKLFAKHIKLKDAVDYVKKTRMGIGVGTPARIIDLLDAGALSSQKLERIVVDCSHIDQKKRGIMDMKETQQPLLRLLNRTEIKNRYGEKHEGIELLFY